MNQNNLSNNHLSSGPSEPGVAPESAHLERESLQGPQSVIIDLGQAIRDFENNVKYARVDIDPGDVLSDISKEIISKDYDKDAVFDFISDLRFNLEEKVRPNQMACIADAIEKLGMALVERLRQHNIYHPETGRFEYGFYGFAPGNMAVFRTLMRR
ncbi:hypothetical protein HDG34_003368 [Paraburkholderia sp. HC6.4b]|uniref:hypothetical protein n=1 Tax=unclassified Paraburkholderia TaxID=2615204 RepID=UPI00161E67AF|nr:MULTISPECIES: hypothetical protein [unclassified Paraburkholderia]MBB5409427.1 hypothetical protein [Paraburkholderia sp. HC6.4b]MBB5451157.1 hypothetical protein [Paraburkholderia sp. Kb1A]